MPKKDFSGKILTPLQKMWFGQNNCCPGHWKVAQSIKNRPVWSHCWGSSLRWVSDESCLRGVCSDTGSLANRVPLLLIIQQQNVIQHVKMAQKLVPKKNPALFTPASSCGQSYKQFTLVNYDSGVVITSKLFIIMTLES